MKNIKVVIGANFGDEGKGLMTDYFASQCRNGIVVRFNGGSQAGHTVVTPDSLRHVFSHFGSGTFVGLPTYLSEFFIVNPMTFKKEHEGLVKKNIIPIVFSDINCLITTPYDVMINQIVEADRGNKRHGSCGLGINETIKRSLAIKLQFDDFFNFDTYLFKLLEIRDVYLPYRLKELGVNSIPIEYIDLLKNENILKNYFKDMKFFFDNVKLTTSSILNDYDDIVFEGAQGLLLDQNSEYFPNVTPSNTGMKNVSKIIKDFKFENENIEITYITRNYMTKHGAGIFTTETKDKPYFNIIDLTNVPNAYQGDLRFGLLDVDLLRRTIKRDLNENAKDIKYKANLAITCLDQVDGDISYIVNSKNVKSDIKSFLNEVLSQLEFENGYISSGLTRNTIKKINR